MQLSRRFRDSKVAPEHPVVDSLTKRLANHWLIAGLLWWMFLACCFPLFDTDLFWHLKTGEWILQNLTIPGYDLYTFTDYTNRWIDLHWGFQVVAAVLYRIGGANLLILTKAAILTLALGVGCYSGGASLREWQRVLCWLLPAMTISGRGYERPEIVTALCLATWLAIVVRLESRPHWIWFLPALQVFWNNCHALSILGLVVGACYAVDHVARHAAAGRWRLGEPPKNVSTPLLVRVGALCAAAQFVNPYLEEGAFFPFVLFRKFTVEQDVYLDIGEFQPPIRFLLQHGFKNLYLNAEMLLWLAAAVSFVVLAVRGRFSIFRMLLFSAFSFLAWKASRNTNIFSMVAGFVLAENLSEPGSRRRLLASAASDADKPVLAGWTQRGLALLLSMMILATVTGEWNRHAEKNRPFRLGEATAWFAHDAARFMGRPGYPQRVFASNFGVASVYSYHNGPEGKVFMDGRLEVCSRAMFERFGQISRRMSVGDPAWVELLRDKDGSLPAVMLDSRYSRGMIEGAIHTPGWRLVFADQAAAVFFDETTADTLNLPAVSPDPLLYPPDF